MKTRLFILAIATAIVLSAVLPMMLTQSASAQGGGVTAHILNTQGTLGATGQYTQSMGTFIRLVEGTPTPTPTPMPTPTATPCQPVPGIPGGFIYFGTYTLSNNESGNIILSVQDGDNAATGTGAPQTLPPNPVIAEQGPLTINLQIDIAAGTGTGTLSFTSAGTVINGTITITNKFPYPPTDPVTCGTPTPTPTPAGSPTPSPSPTPSTVEVSGRVFTPSGLGLRNAVVAITDSLGVRRTATTSSFGNYRFESVTTNEAYVLGAVSKRYRFTAQVILVTGPMSNVDFTGLE